MKCINLIRTLIRAKYVAVEMKESLMYQGIILLST